MTEHEHTGPELPLDDEHDAEAGHPSAEEEESTGLDALVTALDKRPAHATEALDAPPKSLPVLAAFQEFIEDERKRSQNRMLIISGFFLIILVSVIGTGLTIGTFVFRHMRDEVTEVRRNFTDLQKSSMESKASVDTSLARFQGQAEGLRYHMEKQDRAIDKTREDLTRREDEHGQKLAELRKVIESLESENTALKSGLTELKSNLPDLTEQVDTALSQLESELAAIRNQRPVTPATQVVVQVASSGTPAQPRATRGIPESVIIPIVPRGETRAVDWRLTIPE